MNDHNDEGFIITHQGFVAKWISQYVSLWLYFCAEKGHETVGAQPCFYPLPESL
jgi:hypothetical protein